MTEPRRNVWRVLHVSPSVARRDGGPVEALRGFILSLGDEGIAADVVATDKGLAGSESLDDLPIVELFHARPPYSWTFSPGMLSRMDDLVQEYDLVHIHGLDTFPGSVAMRACRKRDVPFVLEPHGSLDIFHHHERWLRKFVYRASVDRANLRACRGFVVSSERERSHGRKNLLTTPDQRWWVVGLGVDARLFALQQSRARDAAHDLVVLFLGRVTAKKNLDLVLRGVAIARERGVDVCLKVAGPIDPALEWNPIELIRDLGLGPYVEMLGQVDRDDREALLSSADVFVLPSEDESFGVAMAEALAAGTLVVASAEVGIAPEAAAAGAAMLCETNATSIADRLEWIDGNGREATAMRNRARQYASERFEWSRAARSLAAVYAEVLEAT